MDNGWRAWRYDIRVRFMRQYFQKMRGFSQNRHGAVAIEFAIVAPLLFLLIGWILEFGVILFTEYSLQRAVETAGREVRTGKDDPTGAVFRGKVCADAPWITGCETRLGVWSGTAGMFNNITIPPLDSIEPGTTGGFDDGGPEDAMVVIVVLDWTFALPLMNVLSNIDDNNNARRLHGIAVFRNEPA
jgi:hypothetical protein